MGSREWKRTAAILTGWVVCATAIGGCGGRAEPCVPCVATELDEAGRGEIASVEADLAEVQVGPLPGAATPDRTFQLSAWYLDATNEVITGRFDPFIWTFDPEPEGTTDPFGKVTISTFPTAPGDATVRVGSGDGKFTDAVTLSRWPDAATAAATGTDVVEVHHGTKLPPSVVLLEEASSGICTWGQARAFVGIAAVGEQAEKPCSVSLLSADRAMLFQQQPSDAWKTSKARISLDPANPRALPVTVFIAVTGRSVSQLSGLALTSTAQLAADVSAGAKALAQLDVTWANMAYEANRVGITIDASYVVLEPTTPELAKMVGADPFKCSKPRGLAVPDADPAKPFQYDPDAISVYYVDWIDYPSDPTHPGARGVHCHSWLQGTKGPVIFISYTKHSTITLAHEIGHALGLEDEEDRLGALNVMHNLLPDGPLGADARSRLTVGQVFRMNVWNGSWITTRTVGAPKRLCRMSDPCPPVDLDAH